MQALPYFDRLDYVAPMSQEHGFALATETLMGIQAPPRAHYLRVVFAEISRILNHLLNVTTFALDVGAITPLLWGFQWREELLDFYERASGSRFHANYFRPGGVHQDIPPALIDDIRTFCELLPKRIDDLESLITENRIFKQRTVDIGIVTAEEALDWGFTGPMLRGLRRALGSPQIAALRGLCRSGFRHSDRQAGRLLGPLSRAHRGDAPKRADHFASAG